MAADLPGKWFISKVSGFGAAECSTDPYLGISTLADTKIGTATSMHYADLGYKAGPPHCRRPDRGIVTIFLGRTGFVIQRLREMRLTAVPEFVRRRDNRDLRVLIGISVAMGSILNMDMILKIEGTFLAISNALRPSISA